MESKTQIAERLHIVHEKMKVVHVGHLSFYGFIQCDVTNYERYTMPELVNEFCSEVPCFFMSYYHLHLLFKHRYDEANQAMFDLRTDLQLPPAARVQTKLARIIHMYFINLPWF